MKSALVVSLSAFQTVKCAHRFAKQVDAQWKEGEVIFDAVEKL